MTAINTTFSGTSGESGSFPLWEINNILIQRIDNVLNEYLERNEKFLIDNNWKQILAGGFLFAFNQFKAIQYLMNPKNGEWFPMEGCILARSLWEIWVDLAYINLSDHPEKRDRCLQFVDASFKKGKNFIKGLKEVTDSPPSEHEEWFMQETMEIQNLMEGEGIEPFPNIEQRVETIAKEDHRFEESKKLYYDAVFREFSALAHLSYITISNISHDMKKSPYFSYSDNRISIRCLAVSFGHFFFIAEIWNNTFKIIESKQLDQWFDQWVEVRNGIAGR